MKQIQTHWLRLALLHACSISLLLALACASGTTERQNLPAASAAGADTSAATAAEQPAASTDAGSSRMVAACLAGLMNIAQERQFKLFFYFCQGL